VGDLLEQVSAAVDRAFQQQENEEVKADEVFEEDFAEVAVESHA